MCIRLGAYASLWKIKTEISWLERRGWMCGHWHVTYDTLSTINFYHAAFSLDSTKRANVWLRFCSFQFRISFLCILYNILCKTKRMLRIFWHDCWTKNAVMERAYLKRTDLILRALLMCHTKRTMGIERTSLHLCNTRCISVEMPSLCHCVFLDILHEKSLTLKIT